MQPLEGVESSNRCFCASSSQLQLVLHRYNKISVFLLHTEFWPLSAEGRQFLFFKIIISIYYLLIFSLDIHYKKETSQQMLQRQKYISIWLNGNSSLLCDWMKMRACLYHHADERRKENKTICPDVFVVVWSYRSYLTSIMRNDACSVPWDQLQHSIPLYLL